MEQVFGCKLSVLSVTLPQEGAYLGGSMTLHGKNLTLACFHGINFRSKSWALFTMEEPYIRFTTDATDLIDDGGLCSPSTELLPAYATAQAEENVLSLMHYTFADI